jgi:hypothetical protein
MAEFLHIEKISLDEITDIYINELQIKFNTMLESFKKAVIPADQMEFTVKRELSFVIDLSEKIDMELGDLGGIDNTPLPEANGPVSYFEYLAIQSTADDLGPFIPGTIKNKDAYWERVKLTYRKSLFEGYIWFLQGMLNTVFDTSQSSEYWNMRTIAEKNRIRETPPEPTPGTQTLVRKKQIMTKEAAIDFLTRRVLITPKCPTEMGESCVEGWDGKTYMPIQRGKKQEICRNAK